MKRKGIINDTTELRQKAEKQLKKKLSAANMLYSEAEMYKLIHELKVHQIELEMQNEELLRAKEQAEVATEKYIDLYDFAPSSYFTLSFSGRILDLNLSGAKILGLMRPQVKNRAFSSYVTADAKPVFNLFLKNLFLSNAEESCELTLWGNGESPVYVSVTGIAVENSKQCLVTLADITESKQAAQALREVHWRLESIVEGANVGTWEWNIKTGKTVFNEVWTQIIGFTTDQLGPMSLKIWKTLTHPDDFKRSFEMLRQHFAGELPCYDNECRMKHKDGHWVWVRDRGRIITRTDDGKPLMMFGTSTDITDRKLVEESLEAEHQQLLKLNSEKDKFFSIVAHDLRSPFNGFLGLTEILVLGLPGMKLDKIRKMALMLRNSATNLYNLLGNLLEWSRMQRGLTAFVPSSFLLMPKISESMVFVKEAADKKAISISYEVPEKLSVFADGNMVGGILRNLVTNAVKFTPKGGEVTVSARSTSDKTVEISIKDTGIGLSQDRIDNLFRLDENTCREGTDGEPSSGLGLILCKDFIEKHGGKLWVESTQGKGSTFYFTIPFIGE